MKATASYRDQEQYNVIHALGIGNHPALLEENNGTLYFAFYFNGCYTFFRINNKDERFGVFFKPDGLGSRQFRIIEEGLVTFSWP
jgi:hypothetical protein